MIGASGTRVSGAVNWRQCQCAARFIPGNVPVALTIGLRGVSVAVKLPVPSAVAVPSTTPVSEVIVTVLPASAVPGSRDYRYLMISCRAPGAMVSTIIVVDGEAALNAASRIGGANAIGVTSPPSAAVGVQPSCRWHWRSRSQPARHYRRCFTALLLPRYR